MTRHYTKRATQSAFQVCSYWHDHPVGDPSYDDCEHAAEIQRARIAALRNNPAGWDASATGPVDTHPEPAS